MTGKPVYLIPDGARIVYWSQIKEAYERLHSIGRVAEELQISKSYAGRILKDMGVALNEPGGQPGVNTRSNRSKPPVENQPAPTRPTTRNIRKRKPRTGVKVFDWE